MDNLKIKAYPSHLIKTDEGVLVSRGIIKFKLIGQDVYSIIQKILQLTHVGLSKNEIISQFDEKYANAIDDLIGALLERNILYYAPAKTTNQPPMVESPEDIFYWHFNSVHFQRKSLNNVKLLLTGDDALSKHLLYALKLAGFEKITLINDLLLNIPRFVPDNSQEDNDILRNFLNNDPKHYDCLIATSDTNSAAVLSFWNKISLEKNWHYLPIALNTIHGYVGPYIIPNTTPCFECLIARENANLSSPELMRNSSQSPPDMLNVNGFHPVMPMILAGLASMELAKIFTEIYTQNIGKLITLNFMSQKMQSHKVLRVPHCKLCSTAAYV